jgi:hypothetical protein
MRQFGKISCIEPYVSPNILLKTITFLVANNIERCLSAKYFKVKLVKNIINKTIKEITNSVDKIFLNKFDILSL